MCCICVIWYIVKYKVGILICVGKHWSMGYAVYVGRQFTSGNRVCQVVMCGYPLGREPYVLVLHQANYLS